MLLLGVAGLLGGYLYTGGPKGYEYLALGDVFVFLLIGPLMVVGPYYSNVAGFRASRIENLLLPVSAYLVVTLIARFRVLSIWSLLVFLSLPLTIANLRDIKNSGEESARELSYLVVRAAQLHLVFGVLLSTGIAIGALTGS
jgi:1,4-dihydroxy-2-naphthoate octaprenyltransferase